VSELMAARCEPVRPPGQKCAAGDDLFACGDPERKWYVLHTKSRREKKLVERCSVLGIPSYLPLRRNMTVCRGRRHAADVPMFPGYAFAYLRREDRIEVYRTGHTANVIDVFDQQGLLSDLRRIKEVHDRGGLLVPEPVVKRGARVRIVDGPLAGLDGIVRTRKGKSRLILSVDCIRQAVACEVDISMVVPL